MGLLRNAATLFIWRKIWGAYRRLKGPEQAPGALRIKIILPDNRAVPDSYNLLTGEGEGQEYLYLPENPDRMLSPAQLSNLALCVRLVGLDMALASHSLAEPPAVGLAHWRDGCLMSAEAKRVLVDGGFMARRLNGRVVRQLPAPAEVEMELSLTEIFAPHDVTTTAGSADFQIGLPWPTPHVGFGAEPDRPVILVLPILLAVGGVERNTIEIIAALRERYNFVVATTERLRSDLGSLHAPLIDAGAVIYDLADIAPNDRHLDLLATIKYDYKPALVWICNGSPWLADHAGDLRRLFADTPIVDQQVYDTDIGWIERYPEPDIQSFDRFIAINHRIETAFTDRLGMATEKIDMIYPAMAADRFIRQEIDDGEIKARRAAFGLPSEGRVFVQVARLSEQKNPQAFIKLAQASAARGSGDHFVLLGDGPLSDTCDNLIREFELDNVSRIAHCDDVAQFLPLASSLVFTSRYEGLPVAMLEGLAMGVPTFATDVGDVRLILEAYGSGAVAAGTDADNDDYRRAFFHYLKELDRHTAAAITSAERVRKRFSAETVARQYEDCWQQAIAAYASY